MFPSPTLIQAFFPSSLISVLLSVDSAPSSFSPVWVPGLEGRSPDTGSRVHRAPRGSATPAPPVPRRRFLALTAVAEVKRPQLRLLFLTRPAECSARPRWLFCSSLVLGSVRTQMRTPRRSFGGGRGLNPWAT